MGAALGAVLLFGLTAPGRAAESTDTPAAVKTDPAPAISKEASVLLDKAIQALGGEEKLNKAKSLSWKSKSTITFNGNDNDVTTETTEQDFDHFRETFDANFGGNAIKGLTVLAGDKGWRDFGDNHMDMDKDAIVNQKRTVYLNVIPATLVALKGKDFKVEPLATDATGIKVTPTDGKEFSLYFDKDTGLPARLVAKVVGFMGDEFTQETTFSDYKDMAGIKKATKVVSKRNGEKFMDQQITEFTVLDKVDPKLFAP